MSTSRLTLEQKQPVEIIPEQFISVAIDASQIIGGYWWDNSDTVKGGVGNRKVPPLNLNNENLIRYTKVLSPYCIRIGGTEADRIFYSLKKSLTELPKGYHYYLGKERWKELERFAKDCGSRLMITINAGPGPRIEKQRWRKKNARQLIRYAHKKNHAVAVWELGNEVNAYPFFMGSSHRMNPKEYAGDMKKLKNLIPEDSQARTAGPALAVWPVIGETLPFLKRFLKHCPVPLDILTWHYYPQQSSRSIAAVRRSRKKTMLKPSHLDEIVRQTVKLKTLRDRYQPEAEMWLGETGHALCGGEPGLSDTFYSGFWWLDQLGLMALHNQKQVVRQTLSGGDYGLLDKEDHTPLPDYWTTLLWNRYAGTQVYKTAGRDNKKLRLYCHSLKGRREGYCIIFVSLEEKEKITLHVDASLPEIQEEVVLSSSDIYSREIRLNGETLEPETLEEGLKARKITPGRTYSIDPLSYGFLLLY
ncbi:MAG: hypothetical protein PQJ58_12770 [Spirochaetales bacterium]|nr:hypothetical protein [Spirochaetales bacterium]